MTTQAELDFMHNFRHETDGGKWAKREIESLRQQIKGLEASLDLSKHERNNLVETVTKQDAEVAELREHLRRSNDSLADEMNISGKLREQVTLQARSDKRWKETFGGMPRTTTQLAAKFGYSHMGALSSLYKLEKRKQVERVGTAPSGGNRPVILWQWIGD